MARLRLVSTLLVALTLATGLLASVRPDLETDRQRIAGLFQNLHSSLLTIHAEIVQAGHRFGAARTALQDPELWVDRTAAGPELAGRLRELNRLKLSLALIGSGLERKYARIKGFQDQLEERYPDLAPDIALHFGAFDKTYTTINQRHQSLRAQMNDLRTWISNRTGPRASTVVRTRPPLRVTRHKVTGPVKAVAPLPRVPTADVPRTDVPRPQAAPSPAAEPPPALDARVGITTIAPETEDLEPRTRGLYRYRRFHGSPPVGSSGTGRPSPRQDPSPSGPVDLLEELDE